MDRPLPSAGVGRDLTASAYLGADEPFDGEDGGHDGAWLISFVDILTLLVTLMALLLAFAYFPQRAHPQAATAMSAAAEAPAAAAAVLPPATRAAPVKRNSVSHLPIPRPGRPLIDGPPTPRTAQPPPVAQYAPRTPAATARDRADLERAIPPDIKSQVKLSATAHRINLAIKDDVLFNVGSADLTAAGGRLLDHVARLLNRSDYPVSVEGHTDDTPIHTARFPSNWELSAARATNVTRYLIAHGVAAERLRATGYGDTRPLASNATAAGRAQNRRVALVLHVNRSANARRD